MAFLKYSLDQVAQKLVLDAKKRDVDLLNQFVRMREAIDSRPERFWEEYLRLWNLDKEKAQYWKETWDQLVETMKLKKINIPNDDVQVIAEGLQRLDRNEQRLTLNALTKLCDRLVSQTRERNSLNQSVRMREAIDSEQEQFLEEYLHLWNLDREKARYWKETWDQLVETMKLKKINIPNDGVQVIAEGLQRLDRNKQRLTLDALTELCDRLVLKAKERNSLNESFKMREAIIYGLERFWGEHLRLQGKDKNKAKYWEETWDRLVETMAKMGITIPNDNVKVDETDVVRAMAEKLWKLEIKEQRLTLTVLTQLCDCLVWWTQRYKGTKDKSDG